MMQWWRAWPMWLEQSRPSTCHDWLHRWPLNTVNLPTPIHRCPCFYYYYYFYTFLLNATVPSINMAIPFAQSERVIEWERERKVMDPTVKKQSSSSDGTIRAVRAAIRLLALMIFLGILVLFVMMPTNTYKKKWFVQVVATTDSTYFGRQGLILIPMKFNSVSLTFIFSNKISIFDVCRCHHPDLYISSTIFCCPGLCVSPFGKETE